VYKIQKKDYINFLYTHLDLHIGQLQFLHFYTHLDLHIGQLQFLHFYHNLSIAMHSYNKTCARKVQHQKIL